MITVRQALGLPCMATAHVLGGSGGLDHALCAVRLIEQHTKPLLLAPGTLLLVTPPRLHRGDEPGEALLESLAQQDGAGLILLAVPAPTFPSASLRQVADRLGVPLLLLPDAEATTVAGQLLAAIVEQRYAVERRSQEIHRQLTQIVLTGGDLAAVAAMLASFLDRSVLIEDAAFSMLATSQRGPVDAARYETMMQGHTSPSLVAELVREGVYPALQAQARPLRLAGRPDTGMSMDRVVAPITIGGEAHGYIWIVAGDRPLTELDELVIDNVATVAALLLLKEQAVREAHHSIRGDMLAQLLSLDAAPDAALREQARRVGYRFEQPQQALFLLNTPAKESTVARSHLAAQVESWLEQSQVTGFAVARERGVALIVETHNGLLLAERLSAELLGTQAAVGIGRHCLPGQPLRRSYDEAAEAAEIGLRLGQSVCPFWTLGLLHWLHTLPPEALGRNHYYACVQHLASDEPGRLLLGSLEAYLDAGGALADAANMLHIHRNTLAYRLARLTQLTSFDLANPTERLNLHLALKALRLRG